MCDFQEYKKVKAKGVKREEQRIEYEIWQSTRMFSKTLPSHFVSTKQRIAGWSYLIDQLVILSLIVSIPTAVLNIEINVFNYIFEWLGFTTINFYDYSN